MRICIICHQQTSFYKKINDTIINECPNCQLAYTAQYDGKAIYNLNDYLTLKNRQQNKFKKIVNKISKTVIRGNILEVGAGFGLFSSLLAKNKKFHIEVIEPHLPLYFLKKNPNVLKHKKTYEEFLKKNKQRYDGVIFLDVLEHFKKPEHILKQTHNILKNNGYLILQFPNYRSLMAKLCRNWSWWMLEDHEFHFSPRSAKLILEKEGYQIIYLTTYENNYEFKKNLDGNFTKIKNGFIRKMTKVIYFSLFFSCYFLLRQLFWTLGYGGLIFLIAKKNHPSTLNTSTPSLTG